MHSDNDNIVQQFFRACEISRRAAELALFSEIAIFL